MQVINEKGSLSNPYPRYHVNIANSDDTDIDQSKTPAWLVQPGDMTVAQHTPVTIACVVSSFPKPTYRWTFNSSPFTGEYRFCVKLMSRECILFLFFLRCAFYYSAFKLHIFEYDWLFIKLNKGGGEFHELMKQTIAIGNRLFHQFMKFFDLKVLYLISL